jgi:hypothetical protein
LMDCLESTGVDRLMDGRLRAAGLMSTMADFADMAGHGGLEASGLRAAVGEVRCAKGRQGGRARDSAQAWGEPALICASGGSPVSRDRDAVFKMMDRAWWRSRMDDMLGRWRIAVVVLWFGCRWILWSLQRRRDSGQAPAAGWVG